MNLRPIPWSLRGATRASDFRLKISTAPKKRPARKRAVPREVELAAYDAVSRLGERFPLFGLDVRWTGKRTSEAFEVERKVPNAYLAERGYPERTAADLDMLEFVDVDNPPNEKFRKLVSLYREFDKTNAPIPIRVVGADEPSGWVHWGQSPLQRELRYMPFVLLGIFLLVSFAVILANLVTDLLNGWLDPRI